MNIPVGPAKELNISLSEFNLIQKLVELTSQSFTGYVVLTAEGFDGIDEGLIFLKKGLMIGSIYEYCKYEKQLFGEEAFSRTLNIATSKHGVVDVYLLSSQQVDLITAFNEKILLAKPWNKNEIQKQKLTEFDSSYAKQDLKGAEQKEESKYNILKKLGLSRFG